MNKRFWILFTIIALSLSMGCYKKVVHTPDGRAFCPYPEQKGKKLVYHEVESHTDFCETCKKNFRWTDSTVRCWACNGQSHCNDCRGSGKIYDTEGVHNKCTYCSGTGECSNCGPNGHSVHGGSPIRLYDQRLGLMDEDKDQGQYPK